MNLWPHARLLQLNTSAGVQPVTAEANQPARMAARHAPFDASAVRAAIGKFPSDEMNRERATGATPLGNTPCK